VLAGKTYPPALSREVEVLLRFCSEEQPDFLSSHKVFTKKIMVSRPAESFVRLALGTIEFVITVYLS
jgi:hypothetical protein